MSADGQSVEEWAQSHRFSQPLRLAEVEAGVLARSPATGTGMPGWVAAVGALGLLSLAIFSLIGPGVSVLGLATVWLAGREDPPGVPPSG